ncbi:MAG TPA: hypothetical protein VGK82_04095, partial [Pyrinomonadaceae bacterium]
HEVEEIRAGVKRNLGDRRLRVANNIRVRRAALALSKASDLDEMFEVVGQMLDFGEFTFANAQVGRVCWSWSKPERVDHGSEPHAEWSFRLPLVKDGVEWGWVNFYRSFNSEALLLDTNYLSDLFRRELTDTVARILKVDEVSESPHVAETVPMMAMQMAAKG